jgi:hypothetical protein
VKEWWERFLLGRKDYYFNNGAMTAPPGVFLEAGAGPSRTLQATTGSSASFTGMRNTLLSIGLSTVKEKSHNYILEKSASRA